MAAAVRGSTPPSPPRPGPRLPLRFAFYLLVLVVVLLARFHPDAKKFLPDFNPFRETTERLVIGGVDTAPSLIPLLAADYQRLFPDAQLRLSSGGTLQALEELINRRADVAFLTRPPSERERAIIRAAGDSALCFPIALGAVLVISGKASGIDSLSLGDLRDLLGGERSEHLLRPRIERVYFPDPNNGLWEAVTDSLLPGAAAPESLIWLAGDREVLEAAGNDPASIGFVSSLSAATLDRARVQSVALSRSPGQRAFTPSEPTLAAGDYPLFHYLYVSCRPEGGPAAAAFVTHLFSGRGQRLVSRSGFLPARDVARLVHVVSRPVGAIP